MRTLLALAFGAAVLLPPRVSSACAVMIPEGAVAAPTLGREQVLLVYDEATSREHFVREVRFDGAKAAFGFVVPTPSKPEVAGVSHAPFADLARDFPFEAPPQNDDAPPAQAVAVAAAPTPRGVEVLSVQKIGTFTAFVLAATDAGALDRWLAENHVALPSGGRPWLEHYVARRSFFTAFRYEGADGTSLTSETVRLSFDTPLPYYPYLEPEANDPGYRAMDLWLVSSSKRDPTDRRWLAGQPARWAWPWRAGLVHEKDGKAVAASLGEPLGALVGSGKRYVQTFRDTRGSRRGFSDVVFPKQSESPGRWTPPATALLGDLERGLHEARVPEEREAETIAKTRSCACDAVGSPAGDAPLALALAAFGLVVRRATGARTSPRGGRPRRAAAR